jgi:hypothetical protein
MEADSGSCFVLESKGPVVAIRRILVMLAGALVVGGLLNAGQNSANAESYLLRTRSVQLKGVPGKLDHLAVDNKGQRLFVANKPNNSLDIIDLKSGAMVKQIPGQGKASGVSYAEDLDIVYVGNGAGTCNAFDGKTYEQVFSAKAPNADNVHYFAEKQLVYVGQDEIMSVLDAKNGDSKAKIDLPGAVHGFRIDGEAKKIYAVVTKENAIAVIDMESNKVTNKFPLTLSDAGSPIAADRENGLLFVGCPKAKPMVVIFDVKTGKEIDSVEIPAGVDDIHYDRRLHRIYASCSDKALVVIEKQNSKFEVVAKIETPKDSRTCVFSRGKLYLGVPQQEGTPGPDIWIYDAVPNIDR